MSTNTRIKTIALLCFFFAATIITQAQISSATSGDGVMQPPNAAGFSKYGDIPVNLSTGSANVSIPIHQIRHGDLSVPISLTYHTSGIRTAEEATWVGLGWNLNVGGEVTRSVAGIPDDDANGYINKGSQLDISDPNQMQEVAGGDRDGEPDIFNFQAGNYSGKFFIDHNGDVVLTPFQDINIEYSLFGGRLEQFVITTPDGTRYTYGRLTSTGSTTSLVELFIISSIPDPYITSWKLKRITSFDLLYVVDYNYSVETYKYTSPAGGTKEYCAFSSPNAFGGGASTQYSGQLQYGNFYGHIYSIIGSRLTSITTPTCTMSFVANTDRSDLEQSASNKSKRLDAITIATGTTKTFKKKYKLNYGLFTDGNYQGGGLLDYHHHRLRLDEVEVTNDTETIDAGSYEIEYSGNVQLDGSIFLPHKLTRANDHWGYYNGQEVSNNAQVVNHPSIELGNATISGTDRETYEQYMHYGSLKKITYPMGGFTEFTLEANEFKVNETFTQYVVIVPQTSTCPISTQSNCCGNNSGDSQPFSFQTQAQINEALVMMTINSANTTVPVESDCDDIYTTIMFVRLKRASDNYLLGNISLSNSTTNGTYATMSMNKDLTDWEVIDSIEIDTSYYFELVSDDGEGVVDLVREETTQQNDVIDIGGLRLKQTVTNDGIHTGNQIVKNYTYETTAGDPSSHLYNKPLYKFQSFREIMGTTVYYAAIFANPVVPLSSYEGYHVGYSQVVVDHVGAGSQEYQFTAGENATTSYHPFCTFVFPIPPDRPRIESNLLAEEKTKNGTDTTLFERDITYESRSYTQYDSVKTAQVFPFACGGSFLEVSSYVLKSSIQRPVSTISTLDGVSTTQTLSYNISDDYYALQSETMTNSDGKDFLTEFTYPDDLPGTVYSEMKIRNILTPIITTKKVDGTTIDASRTNFALYNGVPYAQSTDRREFTWVNGVLSETTPSWPAQATVNSYDLTRGRPSSVTIDGWQARTYTWDQSGLILNTTYDGHTTSCTYHPGTRLKQKVTQIDGTFEEYDYDDLFRLDYIDNDCRNVSTEIEYLYGDPATGGNYRRTTTTYPNTVNSALDEIINKSIFDGLGRPHQDIAENQGPNSNDDVISAAEYDDQGRIFHQYEPRAITSNNGAYQDSTSISTWDRTTLTYEESPLRRLISSVHTDWDHPTQRLYGSNTTPVDGIGVGQLYKVTSIDGDKRQSISYTDKRRRPVATVQADSLGGNTLSTITRYDDKDRSVLIIPPSASASDAELIFIKSYYGNDLLKFEKTPDKDQIEYRYNNKDLPIGYQDGYLRAIASNQWVGMNYDVYGREIKTGFINTAPTNNTAAEPAIATNDQLSLTTYNPNTNTHKDKASKQELRVMLPDGAMGQLLSMDFVYDGCGRSESSTASTMLNANSAIGHSMSYDFDNADNITRDISSINAYSQTQIITSTTTVDFAGREDEIRHQYDSLLAQTLSKTHYTEKNQIAQLQLGKVSGTDFLQDVDYAYRGNQLLDKINQQLTTSSDDLFYQDLYYDSGVGGTGAQTQMNGNIAQTAFQVRGAGRQLFSYQYDPYNRLTKNITLCLSCPSGSPATNAFLSEYVYDGRGNMTTLKRNGQYPNGGGFSQGQIDDLTFDPVLGSNQVKTISEAVTGALKNRGAKSSNGIQFIYDDNGNMTFDATKALTIDYNHLNMPRQMITADSSIISFTYDALGTLLRKEAHQGGAVLEDRYYIGSLEFSKGKLVQMNHAHGRLTRQVPCDQNQFISGVLDSTQTYQGSVISSDALTIPPGATIFKAAESIVLNNDFEVQFGKTFEAEIEQCPTSPWQYEYAISDNVGHARVLFADVDNDGDVEDDEVLQENHYYPNGMPLVGEWQNRYKQDFNYQWYGAERHRDFGLDIDLHPFRGRISDLPLWLSPEPLGEVFAAYSPYAVNGLNPISNVDPLGLNWYRNRGTGDMHWQQGDDDVEDHVNVGANYTIWGATAMITHYQNEVVNVKKYEELAVEMDDKIQAAGTSSVSSLLVGYGYTLANNGAFRGLSGNYYSLAGRKGWNQYTGTKARMNSTVSKATIAARTARGIGLFNYGYIGYQRVNNQITSSQALIEGTSNSLSTFTVPWVSIPWTVGYEGVGRQLYGRNPFGVRDKLRPWVRKTILGIKEDQKQ